MTGELTRLQITSDRHVAIAWGQVIYAISEMGFAIRFVFGDEEDEQSLNTLIPARSDS